jgi:hypothetical protein
MQSACLSKCGKSLPNEKRSGPVPEGPKYWPPAPDVAASSPLGNCESTNPIVGVICKEQNFHYRSPGPDWFSYAYLTKPFDRPEPGRPVPNGIPGTRKLHAAVYGDVGHGSFCFTCTFDSEDPPGLRQFIQDAYLEAHTLDRWEDDGGAL